MEKDPQRNAQKESPVTKTSLAATRKPDTAAQKPNTTSRKSNTTSRESNTFNLLTLQMARRLEGVEAETAIACVAALRRFRPNSRAAFQRIGSGVAVFTGIDSPITQAVGIGLEGPVRETQIEQLEKFYDNLGDAVRVELCPLADKSVTEHFGERGYRVVDYSNVLLRPLVAEDVLLRSPVSKSGRSKGSKHNKFSDEIIIEKIGTADADLWTETVARGFAEQVAVTPDLLEVLKMFVYAAGSECYLARVAGQPAGGAAFGFRKGIASLSGASTLPEFRNRGVQTALLQARLARGKAQGCEFAMTIAHPGSISHRNIERLGFRVVYTRVKFQKDKKSAIRT